MTNTMAIFVSIDAYVLFISMFLQEIKSNSISTESLVWCVSNNSVNAEHVQILSETQPFHELIPIQGQADKMNAHGVTLTYTHVQDSPKVFVILNFR